MGRQKKSDPDRFCIGWALDSLVGGTGVDYRRRNQRGHVSRDARRRLQNPEFRVRPVGDRHGSGPDHHRFHLYPPLLPLRCPKYLRVSRNQVWPLNQKPGQRDLSADPYPGNRGQALSRGGDHQSSLGIPFPGSAHRYLDLFLGDRVRDRVNYHLHGDRRN